MRRAPSGGPHCLSQVAASAFCVDSFGPAAGPAPQTYAGSTCFLCSADWRGLRRGCLRSHNVWHISVAETHLGMETLSGSTLWSVHRRHSIPRCKLICAQRQCCHALDWLVLLPDAL